MTLPRPLWETADAEVVLALVLEQTGPVTIPVRRLDEGPRLEVVTTLGVPFSDGLTVEVRRRETILERATSMIAESGFAADGGDPAELAAVILDALGADPNSLAPPRDSR